MNAVRGLPFVADDPRSAAALPRRKRRDRYAAVYLTPEQIEEFYRRVSAARERRTAAESQNVRAFRDALEARYGRV